MNTITENIYRDEDGYCRASGQLTADEVLQAECRLGRNEGPGLLFDLVLGASLTDEVLAQVIGPIWSAAERPEWNVDYSFWTTWFRRVGLRNEAGIAVDRPDSMRVYRGSDAGEGVDRPHGMSWTTEPGQAGWFAQRGQRPGVVHSVTVPGSVLLADLRDGERGEMEVILDTRHADFPAANVTTNSIAATA